MASFTFNYAVPNQGTTFTFGSWVCVANGSGGFDSYLSNPRELEATLANKCSITSDHANITVEMLLPDLPKEIEEKLIFDASSIRSPSSLRSESTQSKILLTQPTFGLRNTASVYEKSIRSAFSSLREEGLDHLHCIRNMDATAHREAPFFYSYPDSDEDIEKLFEKCLDLMTNSTSQGQISSWRGFLPTELLDSLRLVANIDDLPYQHGRPLSPIQDEGSGYTVLADYNSSLDSYSPNRQIFMATGGNEIHHDPNETLY
jgi:hypothetical protein